MSTQALEFVQRSSYCGDVRSTHIGQEIILKGWVNRRRDHGGLIFIDLRDRTGLMQVRINPDTLENDTKIGVDVTIDHAGAHGDLVKSLLAVQFGGLQLTAVSKGDTNIWPDGQEPKDQGTAYRARIIVKDHDHAAAEGDREAVQSALAKAGVKVTGTSFLSRTHQLRDEYVIAVRGLVAARPAESINSKIGTGETELHAREIHIHNPAAALPFKIEDTKTNEELRLKYRYLDLRRPDLQRNFIMRHKLLQASRRYLADNGFLEVETPILGRPTPEGARDYLVPSRTNPGMCYALPQSPQLFKQILMVAGFDRYFQVARCFRDEDLRANRQPEFTQIDIEMSFVGVDDVIKAMEGLAVSMWKDTLGITLPTPFPRLPYSEAIRRFGSDKPDLRFGMELQDITEDINGKTEFTVFKDVIEGGGKILALVHEGGAKAYSNTALRPEGEFNKRVQRETGSKGLAFFRMTDEGDLDSSIAKLFEKDVRLALAKRLGMKPGDIVFMVADKKPKKAFEIGGRLRLLIAKEHNLIDKSRLEFLWVVDFPLFDYDDETKAYSPAHHPFTSPHPEDLHKLESDPGNVRALAYDLALNGEECAGGSIRIHRSDVQARIFRSIGINDEEAQSKFGFLLEAFRFGAPPHGGIAFGFDRCLMSILEVDSIREVIAFPKTQAGTCLMTGAPGEVTEEQLKELHIKSIAKKEVKA